MQFLVYFNSVVEVYFDTWCVFPVFPRLELGRLMKSQTAACLER